GARRIRLWPDQAERHRRSRHSGRDREIRARAQAADHGPALRPRHARAGSDDRSTVGIRFYRHGRAISSSPKKMRGTALVGTARVVSLALAGTTTRKLECAWHLQPWAPPTAAPAPSQ